jgi:hypothetical protein
LVPQVTGALTHARFWEVALFVDHYSDFWHTTLLQSPSNEETLAAKLAYETVMRQHGVQVERYHADNSRFNSNLFMSDAKQKDHEMSFHGVGAHHQNAVTENGNKRLIVSSRIILLHAKRHWPEAISTMIWPFSV